jgi:predicted TIM-barrel enzyme
MPGHQSVGYRGRDTARVPVRRMGPVLAAVYATGIRSHRNIRQLLQNMKTIGVHAIGK